MSSIARNRGAKQGEVKMMWLIDGPARLIGGLAGPLTSLAALVGSVVAAYWASRPVDYLLARPIGNDRVRGYLVFAFGFVCWLYFAAVLYRAQHWMAFSVLEGQR